MSLSATQIWAALRTYRKDTVWYRRDIKGERAVAEGIIFGRFAGTPVPYLYDDSEQIVEGSDGRTRFKKYEDVRCPAQNGKAENKQEMHKAHYSHQVPEMG